MWRDLASRWGEKKACHLAERVFRGGVLTGGAPFTKDAVYQRGYCRVYNFLRVAHARIQLVDNERLEPEQVLFVETTVGVTDSDLHKSVSAALLPETDEQGRAHTYYSADEVSPQVLARGQTLALAPVASEKDYATLHGFKLQAPVGRRIFVKVDKGLRGFGGYILSEVF